MKLRFVKTSFLLSFFSGSLILGAAQDCSGDGDDFLKEQTGFSETAGVTGGHDCSSGNTKTFTVDDIDDLNEIDSKTKDFKCVKVKFSKNDYEIKKKNGNCPKDFTIERNNLTFDGRRSGSSSDDSVTIRWADECRGKRSEPIVFLGTNIIVIGINFLDFQQKGMKDASQCRDSSDCRDKYCPKNKDDCKDVAAITFSPIKDNDWEQNFWVHRCSFEIGGDKFTGATESIAFGEAKTYDDDNDKWKGAGDKDRKVRATFSVLTFKNTNHNFDMKTANSGDGKIQYSVSFCKFINAGERSPKSSRKVDVHFYNNYYTDAVNGAIKIDPKNNKSNVLGEYNFFNCPDEDREQCKICQTSGDESLGDVDLLWNENIQPQEYKSKYLCGTSKGDFTGRLSSSKLANFIDDVLSGSEKYKVAYYKIGDQSACDRHSSPWDCSSTKCKDLGLRSVVNKMSNSGSCSIDFLRSGSCSQLQDVEQSVAAPDLPTEVPPVDDFECDDDRFATFYVEATDKLEPCVWLANRMDEFGSFCEEDHPSQARTICRETCGACSDDCEDTDGTFTYDGVPRPCLWLSIRNWIIDEPGVCDTSSEAAMVCPETCGTCDVPANRY